MIHKGKPAFETESRSTRNEGALWGIDLRILVGNRIREVDRSRTAVADCGVAKSV